MSDGHLPTFILIGAMKCGTTSLHRYLGAHPQICMSEPKEPDFFLERTNRDLDWYKQCFSGQAQEYGEASTNYTKYPGFEGVPERMHRLLPSIKLLYLVRDPIERAVSHYAHNRIDGRESRSVEAAFRPMDESHYLQTSRYYLQISKYLAYYPRERIRIVMSERLRSERIQVLQAVFSFLGVTPDVEPPALEEEYHTTSGKLMSGLSRFFQENPLGRAAKRTGRALLPERLIERVLDVFRSPVERPTVANGMRDELRSYFESDVEQLRTLTGRDFASWSV